MKLIWYDRAIEDLTEIGEYIAKDNSRKASEQLEIFLKSAIQAAKFPYSGRIVPEFKNQNLREIIIGRYRLVYKIHKSTVQVLVVYHCKRMLPLTRLASATKHA